MNEFPEVGELETEARRLLRYRIPLILAVLVNFFLLVRVPYARMFVESPSPPDSASTNLDTVVPAPPAAPPLLYAASQAIDVPAADSAETPHTAAPAAAVQADLWATTFPRLEAALHQHGSAAREYLTSWLSWRPQSAPAPDSADVPADVHREEVAAAPASSTPVDPEPAPADVVGAPPAIEPHDPAPIPSGLMLRNALDNGGPVSFLVNGRAYELLPGEAHEFAAGESWDVQFHRGDSFGNQQRTLTGGAYRFVVTDQGWDLESVRP